MALPSHPYCIVLILVSCAHLISCSIPLEGLGGVTTVKALTAVMYRDMNGWGGAYKLLNATGKIGSQGPDDALVYLDAPLVHHRDLAAASDRQVVVLLPVKDSASFFHRWLTDNTLQQSVQAVLVDDTDTPRAYSTLGSFPWAEYAPYSEHGYAWNSAAGGAELALGLSWWPAPVFLLTADMAADARQRATYNGQAGPQQQQYHARFQLTMTAGAASNSSTCLAAGVCKPLGGYSVWSALPPLPNAPGGPGADGKPIILVVAQMDSMDMFHDAIQGANAPLSGLVTLLGALHALKAAAAADSYSKRIVFLALAGEAWGYMGSRRLLYEAATGSNATAGVDLRLVEKVIEVGQVGALQPLQSRSSAQALYVHTQQGPSYGDARDILAALSAAAQQEASPAQVNVQAASSTNPGIPPSSLMSFLRINASIQGVVLAEFDKTFTNTLYASRFDNGSHVSSSSMASTAAVLAAALHRLAGGDPQQLKVNMTELSAVVEDSMACIILPQPGFACPLASSLMTADYVYSPADGSRSYAPKNYVGVLQYLPDVQGPLGKSNLARLLWNVMAVGTSSGHPGASCDPFEQPCAEGQVCAGWRASGGDAAYLGRCVTATVRYVPSYSTKLTCQSCSDPWGVDWQLKDDADAWNEQYNWPPDPVWTESDWPEGVPHLQLYLHESAAVETGVLIAGFLVTAVVCAASYAARVAFARHHLAWSQTTGR